MDLYGLLRNAECVGDRFVGKAFGRFAGDIELAGRERLDALASEAFLGSRLAFGLVPGAEPPAAFGKLFNAHGFCQKVCGAPFDGEKRHFDVTVSRKENDRLVESCIGHLRLALKSGHAAHANVHHNAPGAPAIVVREEILSTLVARSVKTGHAKRKKESAAQVCVVVNKSYERLEGHRHVKRGNEAVDRVGARLRTFTQATIFARGLRSRPMSAMNAGRNRSARGLQTAHFFGGPDAEVC